MESELDPEEKLRAENELLKLKLALEHGMKDMDASSLTPDIENQWLSNIYAFEQQSKEGKRIKVYDLVGRPDFKKTAELSASQIPQALQHLLDLMEKKGVVLDLCCDYKDAIIYKFITEELFNYETDDLHIDGMVRHFIYEEFHPNHEYDLHRYTEEFIKNLLNQPWNPDFEAHYFAKTIFYKEKEYDYAGISAIILAFQQGRTFTVNNFEITNIHFNLEEAEGKVSVRLAYQASAEQTDQLYEGEGILHFIYDLDYWFLKTFELPGLGG